MFAKFLIHNYFSMLASIHVYIPAFFLPSSFQGYHKRSQKKLASLHLSKGMSNNHGCHDPNKDPEDKARLKHRKLKQG